MAYSKERTFSEEVNTWAQIGAIIAAASWAIYTFVYKEITIPKSAPINVSLNLKLQKIGTGDMKDKKNEKSLTGVEMNVAAKNPSSLKIHLLPSVFIVYGRKITVKDNDLSDYNTKINSESDLHWFKHLEIDQPSLDSIVAIGNLLKDIELKPGEAVKRTLIFYVPVGEYDLLEAHAFIPNGKDIRGIELEWNYTTYQGLVPTIFRNDGKREPLIRDKHGGYEAGPGELQQAYTMSMISLW